MTDSEFEYPIDAPPMAGKSEEHEIEENKAQNHRGNCLAVQPIATDVDEKSITPHCAARDV